MKIFNRRCESSYVQINMSFYTKNPPQVCRYNFFVAEGFLCKLFHYFANFKLLMRNSNFWRCLCSALDMNVCEFTQVGTARPLVAYTHAALCMFICQSPQIHSVCMQPSFLVWKPPPKRLAFSRYLTSQIHRYSLRNCKLCTRPTVKRLLGRIWVEFAGICKNEWLLSVSCFGC